ncbi:MAG: hypothetical protein HXX13_01815 [Bacteroidetes bacterium]|nr:hypothetical protein [Bacteroidota bacterium]
MQPQEKHPTENENISELPKMKSACVCGGDSQYKSKDQLEARYQCPMHCEDNKTYNQEGKCPVCNMQLVKVDLDIQGDRSINM